jgi:hypothetical protein
VVVVAVVAVTATGPVRKCTSIYSYKQVSPAVTCHKFIAELSFSNFGRLTSISVAYRANIILRYRLMMTERPSDSQRYSAFCKFMGKLETELADDSSYQPLITKQRSPKRKTLHRIDSADSSTELHCCYFTGVLVKDVSSSDSVPSDVAFDFVISVGWQG